MKSDMVMSTVNAMAATVAKRLDELAQEFERWKQSQTSQPRQTPPTPPSWGEPGQHSSTSGFGNQDNAPAAQAATGFGNQQQSTFMGVNGQSQPSTTNVSQFGMLDQRIYPDPRAARHG